MSSTLAQFTTLSRSLKNALQMLTDAGLVMLSFAAAMALRLESLHFLGEPLVWSVLLALVPCTLLLFYLLGLYRAVIRYITGQVLRLVAYGVLGSAGLLLALAHLTTAPIPRSVPFFYAVLLFLSVGGLRFVVRGLFRQTETKHRTPVIIYGAGEAGRQVVNALYHGRDYAPIAFVDDDPTLHRTSVAGRRVYPPSALPRLAPQLRVKTVLLALPTASRAQRREIVAALEPTGVEVKTIPSMNDIVAGRASIDALRTVTPEDLLGRDPVPPRADLMAQNITGRVVMVTGAGGSIGSELCRQILTQSPAALILFEQSEYALYAISTELREALQSQNEAQGIFTASPRGPRIEPVLGSVQDPTRVESVLTTYGVQTVFHAAAYKHVGLVEENVVEGIRNNVFGTKIVAEAAARAGVASFTLISTDKAVRPTNFMGASKRMAELVCQALAQTHSATTFSMVRFGNVLGSSGSVIPRFRAQIERGGPVTVTHRDITRFFMTIPEAAQLVIQAGAMAKGGDVFVLDMGDPVKILDLALSMVRLHGLKPYVIEANESPNPARGDIALRIVGLGKGEKLYEELLIGNDPRGTAHARIMSATEIALPPAALDTLLDQLAQACAAYDLAALHKLFLEAPLAFSPAAAEAHDLLWQAHKAKLSPPNTEPPLQEAQPMVASPDSLSPTTT